MGSSLGHRRRAFCSTAGRRVTQCVLATFFIFCAAERICAQERAACEPIAGDLRSHIVRVVARSAHTEPVLPTIEEEKLVPGTCYWQLSLSAANSSRKLTLFLTPDRRFLSSKLIDLYVDQETVDAQLASKLYEDAEGDHVPILGSGAPVTVVVFADFQCPYCASFEESVGRYRRANPGRIRLVFRNLPLSVHAWATPAARAGVCIYNQDPSAFWRFHDFIFSEQRNITAETLSLTVSEFVARTPGIRTEDYSKCLSSALPQQRLDRDLANARSLAIQSTPTIFINGRKYAGFVNDAAFALAVDLAASARSSQTATAEDGTKQ